MLNYSKIKVGFLKSIKNFHIYSVQFSSVSSIVSDSLWPHESQHARPPCPSPSPGVHSDSHPSSQWCHPAISSSVIPFSSCPQSLPASESFPISQLFACGGQSTEFQLQHHSLQRNPRADLPQNGVIGSPFSPRDSQESSPTPQFKSINSSVEFQLQHHSLQRNPRADLLQNGLIGSPCSPTKLGTHNKARVISSPFSSIIFMLLSWTLKGFLIKSPLSAC